MPPRTPGAALAMAVAVPVAVSLFVGARGNAAGRVAAVRSAPVEDLRAPDTRSLTVSGQINPAVNVVDDGISTDAFVVDNDSSGTRFRLDADAPMGRTAVRATFELGVTPNDSSDVSQLDPRTGIDFTVRRAEVSFLDDRHGRLALGQGSSSADTTAEADLSLVSGPIMYASVADIAGGILFTDGTAYSGTTVGRAFSDFDGDRLVRIRYDSPMFGPVQGSASWGQDGQWAAAVTLGGDFGKDEGWTVGDFDILAAASVYGTDDADVDFGYAASASILHDPTGLSLTLSTGGHRLDGGADPTNLYAKVGWNAGLWRIGPTGIGIDFTRGENVSSAGAEGTSVGIAAVQRIGRYGIDVYGQMRRYELDGGTVPDLKDVTVSSFGTKFTF